jgi:hypothetical protein
VTPDPKQIAGGQRVVESLFNTRKLVIRVNKADGQGFSRMITGYGRDLN